MKLYTATASRDGKWWMIRIPDLDGLTQTRRLGDAESTAREYIAATLDVAPDDIAVTVTVSDVNGLDVLAETHSISAGLDYPGVGPEHAWLQQIHRAEYVGITDDEALAAFHHLCRTEGIIPALESSHAVAYAMKLAKTMAPEQTILVNLSGRGDKDIGTVADLSGGEYHDRPSQHGVSVKGAKA